MLSDITAIVTAFTQPAQAMLLEQHKQSSLEAVTILSAHAGLAAARQLDSFGYRVIIVEGHDRPGGRVYTKQLKVSSYMPPKWPHVLVSSRLQLVAIVVLLRNETWMQHHHHGYAHGCMACWPLVSMVPTKLELLLLLQ